MVSRAWWIVVGLALGLVCYYLPWYTHETAGFTTNGFDLAEWSSIHPAVRAESPAMLTSFLLRAPQLALIVALALAANKVSDARTRWILRGIALLLALRFVPPSDFLSSARDDPNYRQMALLTIIGVILTLAAIPFSRAPGRWQDGALAVLLLAGVLTGWIGLSRAGILLDNFEIDVSVGPGIIGLSFVSALTVGLAVWPHLKSLAPASAQQLV